MYHSDELIQLIQSMSKQERRYFNLRATAHKRREESATLTLFKKLVKVPAPASDAEWRRLLDECKAGANPAALKNRLYTQLLDCLADWQAKSSIENTLLRRLTHLDVLFRKRRFEACLNMCKTIITRAEQYELLPILLRALQWQRRIILRIKPADFEECLRNNSSQLQKALTIFNNSVDYLEQVGLFYVAAHKRTLARPGSETQDLAEIMSQPMMQAFDGTLSFTAHMHLLKAHSFYAWMSGQRHDALTWYARIVQHWETQPHRIRDAATVFSADVCNYLTCCIAERKTEGFETLLERIREVNTGTGDAALFRLDRIDFLELSYNLNRGMLTEALETAERVQQGLAVNGSRLPSNRRMILLFNCAVARFVGGRFGAALEPLLAVIDSDGLAARGDLYDFAQILRLLIHFELKDFELLDSLERTTRAHFRQKAAPPTFELNLLKYLRQARRSVDKTQLHASLRALRAELLEILHAPGANRDLGIPEILYWVDSQINAVPIDELFSRGAQATILRDPRSVFPLPILQ